MLPALTIGTTPNAALVNVMLDKAIATLSEKEHPLIHSDRGCHYRWPGWIERMSKAGLERSMSKKGCSPDNSASDREIAVHEFPRPAAAENFCRAVFLNGVREVFRMIPLREPEYIRR